MEKNLLKPFISIVVLMVISILTLAFTVDVKLDFVPGVAMAMPAELDGWIGNELRFCHNPEACAEGYKDASFKIRDLEIPDICPDCGSKLLNMSRSEKEALPDDTEFVKSSFTNSAGARVFTSIVLSGTARDSIHRPQRCLKGQGNNLDGEYTLEVPMEGRDPMGVRVIQASRVFCTAEGDIPYHSYYAYWFVGQDRETPYHLGRMFWLAWDRVVRSKANRWAYIAVSGVRDPENNDYEQEIIDIVQKLYPHILTEEMKQTVYK